MKIQQVTNIALDEGTPLYVVSINSSSGYSFLPLTLKRKEVAVLMNLGESAAIKLLAEYGVVPKDYGAGRGKGLRWETCAVIRVVNILHAKAQKAKRPERKAVSPYSLRGKRIDDLVAELAGSDPAESEVSNGD